MAAENPVRALLEQREAAGKTAARKANRAPQVSHKSSETIARQQAEAEFARMLAKHLPECLPKRLRELAINLVPGTARTLVAQLYGDTAFFGELSSAASGSNAFWTGVATLFYGEERVTVDVADARNIRGRYFCCYMGPNGATQEMRTPPNGGIFHVNRWSWTNEIPAIVGSNGSSAPFLCFHVAEFVDVQKPDLGFKLCSHTVGDIRIPLPIPSHKFMVLQQGSMGTNDWGVVGQYPRTH